MPTQKECDALFGNLEYISQGVVQARNALYQRFRTELVQTLVARARAAWLPEDMIERQFEAAWSQGAGTTLRPLANLLRERTEAALPCRTSATSRQRTILDGALQALATYQRIGDFMDVPTSDWQVWFGGSSAPTPLSVISPELQEDLDTINRLRGGGGGPSGDFTWLKWVVVGGAALVVLAIYLKR